jgi:hypothetical protein
MSHARHMALTLHTASTMPLSSSNRPLAGAQQHEEHGVPLDAPHGPGQDALDAFEDAQVNLDVSLRKQVDYVH